MSAAADSRPSIRASGLLTDYERCAALMASSEPWITLGRSAPFILQGMQRPGREVYLAEREGALLGCAVITMQGAFVGYLQSLCVAPAQRSGGIGALLLNHIEQRIFQSAPNVFLCVSAFNQRAQRFYMRHGYVRIGELPDYVIKGQTEILMRKTIGPIDTFTTS